MWEDCEKNVEDFCKEKLGLEGVKIERAHRTKGNKNRDKPRTIVCKLLLYKDKVNIIKNTKKLEGTDFYIYEDFCKQTVEYWKDLWKR